MAGFAVFFVVSSVSSIEEQAIHRFGPDVTVMVAKEDIREMDTIVETMLEPRIVPGNFVEPSAIRFSGKVNEGSEVFQESVKRLLGNVAVVPIKKGEQIAMNKISETSLRTGLAPQITPGKRAISIGIDEVSSVAKLLKPGDRVDVITVIDAGGAQGSREQGCEDSASGCGDPCRRQEHYQQPRPPGGYGLPERKVQGALLDRVRRLQLGHCGGRPGAGPASGCNHGGIRKPRASDLEKQRRHGPHLGGLFAGSGRFE